MRLAFFIVCMTAIGVAKVHIASQEKFLSNRMETQQCRSDHDVTQKSGQTQLELAYQTSPSAVSARAVAMHLPMVDKHDLNTGLARNVPERRDTARRPRAAVPPIIDRRPDFSNGR
jgi:hypothetical protein